MYNPCLPTEYFVGDEVRLAAEHYGLEHILTVQKYEAQAGPFRPRLTCSHLVRHGYRDHRRHGQAE